MEETFESLILKSAEEGCVLLRNENNALPLSAEDTIAVFGRMQKEFYLNGQGSGGSVHVPYSTNLIDSLLEAQEKGNGPKINSDLVKMYSQWIKENPFDTGGGVWAAEPCSQKEMPVSASLAEEESHKANKALFVIGRTAGEDRDYTTQEGSWYLTSTEKENLKNVCAAFKSVILVLNTSGIIDMSWLDEPCYKNIDAILCAWQGGQEGGRACAEVLCGKENPSGHLSCTIAKDISDYPSTAHFGNTEQNVYEEDIYVGYRYFMTFAPDKVLFPFGFGLSYTQFEISSTEACRTENTISVFASVKNIGKSAGKEVVQVYASLPQGKLGKPAKVLVGFAKTKELLTEESEKIRIDIPLDRLASYDDSGFSGRKNCWVLETGEYRLCAGNDSVHTKEILIDGKDSFFIERTLVLQRLEEACAPRVPFERIRPGNKIDSGSYECIKEGTPLSSVDLQKRIDENLPKEIAFTGNKGISFEQLAQECAQKRAHTPSLLDSFIAQLDDVQLQTIVRGEGMLSQKVTAGIASAFGGLSDSLHDEYGIPCAGCADSPSGTRFDNGKIASLLPIGTQLACTWNEELVSRLYSFEGRELCKNQIDTLLGPGINIQRSPLNGRNFEYYSEDPLLTACMTIASLKGLTEGGSTGTIKHFACNSQEAGRRTEDSVVSERALREIYLKPFELAVLSGYTRSIMSAYNKLNSCHCASNYDLLNTILRKQWGYKGIVMTDWWAAMNDSVTGGEESVKDMASMIRARGSVYMVVDNDGAEKNVYGDNLAEALKDGKLTKGELQQCVKDILVFIMNSPCAKRKLGALKSIKTFEPKQTQKTENADFVKAEETIPLQEGKTVFLSIEKTGLYNVHGQYSKQADDLSQSVCNVLLNGEPCASFECRSTRGKNVSVITSQIQMEKGVYELTLVHVKAGIVLNSVLFTSKEQQPVTEGVLK